MGELSELGGEFCDVAVVPEFLQGRFRGFFRVDGGELGDECGFEFCPVLERVCVDFLLW